MISPAAASTRPASRRPLPDETGAALIFGLILIFFSLKIPEFHSLENLRLLAKQSAQLSLVAAGMTLVVAAGGIDLSVGSVLALSSMTLGWLCEVGHQPLWVGMAGALLCGGLCGSLNGFLIAWMKLPPILVTLAMMAAARAGAAVAASGGSFSELPPALETTFNKLQIAGLPVALWIGLLALAGCHLLLTRTTFGRELLAVGGNRTAALLSGVPVRRVEGAVYVLTGLGAALAAILNTAYKATATPDAGQLLELNAITAVILGGTVLTGGRAAVLGTALGVGSIGALLSGVRLLGREDETAWFLVGVILLLGVEAQRKGQTKRHAAALKAAKNDEG